LTGVSASGAIESPGLDISLPLVSVQAQGELGTIIPITGIIGLSGVGAAGAVGSVTAINGHVVALTGVRASGAVSGLYNASWRTINTVEDAQWELIDTA
jgi:hypothetical protein